MENPFEMDEFGQFDLQDIQFMFQDFLHLFFSSFSQDFCWDQTWTHPHNGMIYYSEELNTRATRWGAPKHLSELLYDISAYKC